MKQTFVSWITVAWLMGISVSLQAQSANTPATSKVIEVQTSKIGTSISLGGTVVPARSVSLTAQLPGRIESIAGEEGTRLKKGDLLAVINTDELQAQRRAVTAEIANADAALRNAGFQYSRELFAGDSPANAPGFGLPTLFDQYFSRNVGQVLGYGNPWLEREASLNNYTTQLEKARNALYQAQSRVQEINAKLEDAKSYAPFDGVIVEKLVEVGDTVQPGQRLFEFSDLDILQIKVDIPSRLIPGIREDMVVPAKLDVGRTFINARVQQIFPTADVVRHTVTVKFELPPNAPAAPGMYAEVMLPDIQSPSQEVAVVPGESIIWRGSLPALFVVNPDGRTELRLIRVGDRLDQNRVVVLSGVQIGEKILATPQPGTASGWAAPQ